MAIYLQAIQNLYGENWRICCIFEKALAMDLDEFEISEIKSSFRSLKIYK